MQIGWGVIICIVVGGLLLTTKTDLVYAQQTKFTCDIMTEIPQAECEL